MKKKISTFLCMLCLVTAGLKAQDATVATPEEPKKTMEIYGAIMLDAGYNINSINPDWYDVMRPTKLLDGDGNTYTPEGTFFMGVRQTRFGIKNYFQAGKHELKTHFEFELFGTGADAGQTTFRLRHAYAEWGKWGFGQTNSVFMDGDVFPNTLEYWGPSGMPFFRNIQVRFMPIQKEFQKMTISLERPGASADQGQYGAGFEYSYVLDNVKFKPMLPDLAAEYRHGGKWGYVELAGIVRSITWKDYNEYPTDTVRDLSGSALGWGLNLSTNINFGKLAVLRGSVTYGAGVQNYMNDADVDVGIKRQVGNKETPVTGEVIPMLGFTAFVDFNWSEKFSSSIGFSQLDNSTSSSQLSTAFKTGQYAVVNFLYYPAKNCMVGIEYQWGSRQNNNFAGDPEFGLAAADGNYADCSKIQMSFKYNFSQAFYGKK